MGEETAITLASMQFNTLALEMKAQKEAGLKEWMDANLIQGVNRDWEYTHIIWKRAAPPDKADWSAQLLDPGTAKIMGYMGVRPDHIDMVVQFDEETGEGRAQMKVLLRTILPIMYLNIKTGEPVPYHPPIAEGVGSCTTKEKRFRVKWENYTGRALIADGGYTLKDLEDLKRMNPDRVIRDNEDTKKVIFYMPDPAAAGMDNVLLKMAAKRCLGSTTPILMKTSQSIVRTNLSRMYDNYNASPNDLYLPGTLGMWRKVLKMVREENRTVYRIDLADGSYLRSTEEHEFPTTECDKRVKDLKVGDVLIRDKISLPLGTAKLEYGWIVGLYLAEGSPLDDGDAIRFALNSSETEIANRIKSIAEPLGARVFPHIRATSPNTMDVKVYGRAFSGLIHQFINGQGAARKRLSKFAWSEGNDFLHQVLEGYEAGDTYTTERRKTPKTMLGFTGKNRELAEDIRCICNILDKRVKITRTRQSDGVNMQPVHRGWIAEKVESYNQLNLETITSIKRETKPAVVYDIDVDGDNLFLLANGIVSHNSEMDAVFQIPEVAQQFSQEIDLIPAEKREKLGEKDTDEEPKEEPQEEDWSEEREEQIKAMGKAPDWIRSQVDDIIAKSNGLITTKKAALSVLLKHLKKAEPEEEPSKPVSDFMKPVELKLPEWGPADKLNRAEDSWSQGKKITMAWMKEAGFNLADYEITGDGVKITVKPLKPIPVEAQPDVNGVMLAAGFNRSRGIWRLNKSEVVG